MCKRLARMMNLDEAALAACINDLEAASGHLAIDVRLLAEIDLCVRRKVSELGLDAAGSLPAEIYHALGQMVVKHDAFLSHRLFGAKLSANSRQRQMAKWFEAICRRYPARWPAAAALKELLRKCPPRHLMRQRGYRSLESMLKRENPYQLIVAAAISDGGWSDKFGRLYSQQLPVGDHACRPASIVTWDGPLTAASGARTTALCRPMGIVVLPILADHMERPGATLIGMLSLLMELDGQRQLVAEATWRQDWQAGTYYLGPRTAAWRHLWYSRDRAAKALHPYLTATDLEPVQPINHLVSLEPALSFWQHGGFVIWLEGKSCLSFNLMDNAKAVYRRLPFNRDEGSAARAELADELLRRYAATGPLSAQIELQFDRQAPDYIDGDVIPDISRSLDNLAWELA